jgi:hypothetical protein
MQLIPFLQKGFLISSSRIAKVASTISGDEIFFRPYDKVNHLAWEIGHLTFLRNTIIKILNPAEKLSVYEGEREAFAPGTSLLANEAYPKLEDLLSIFQTRGERIIELLAEVTPEQWDAESIIKLPFGKTVGEQVSFFLLHENTHYGEMSYLKNIIVRLRD